VHGSWLKTQDSRLKTQGSWFRVPGAGCRVPDFSLNDTVESSDYTIRKYYLTIQHLLFFISGFMLFL
jgi:hypothetical protein